jgi:hypothetical protein
LRKQKSWESLIYARSRTHMESARSGLGGGWSLPRLLGFLDHWLKVPLL